MEKSARETVDDILLGGVNERLPLTTSSNAGFMKKKRKPLLRSGQVLTKPGLQFTTSLSDSCVLTLSDASMRSDMPAKCCERKNL